MNKFTFTQSDGQVFEISGPAGSTREQAEKIFLEQTAAGALVGLRPGDTRENPETTIYKFKLSREDRGTAGVDNLPVLSINSSGSISRLPNLRDVPVDGGINQADFLTLPTVSNSVGLLSSTVVQSLMAQTIKSVDQPADQISQEKGVGIYGCTALQLEAAGYLKPGTCAQFLNYPNDISAWQMPNPDDFVAILSSLGIWTGKDGINSLDDLLGNREAQDQIAYNQISTAYQDLVTSGIVEPPLTGSTQIPTAQVQTSIGLLPNDLVGLGGISSFINSGVVDFNGIVPAGITTGLGTLNQGLGQVRTLSDKIANNAEAIAKLDIEAELAGLVQGAKEYGVNTVNGWINNTVPPQIKTTINQLNRLGQFASQFSNLKLPGSINLQFGALGGIDLKTGLEGTKLPDLSGLDFLSNLSLPKFDIFGGVSFTANKPIQAPAFSGTVNRQTVDVATNQIIGTPKIILPDFGVGTAVQNILGTIDSAQRTLNAAGNVGAAAAQRLG